MLKRPLLIALALGVATSVVVGVANTYLPYSEAKIWVIDAVTVIGARIIGVVYPEGIHGAASFGQAMWVLILVMVVNLAIYTVFWYVCLRLARIFGEYLRQYLGSE